MFSNQITEQLYKPGTGVVDRFAKRKMVYNGYSNWAMCTNFPRRRGAYKFLIKSKRSDSVYLIYLNPEYVHDHVMEVEE